MGRTSRQRCRNKLNSCMRPRPCDVDLAMMTLRRWMKLQSKFSCDLIPAVFIETGRGVMTRQRIHPGNVIISLPVQLLITTKTVLQSEIGDHIKQWTPKLTPQQCITVFLIWEMNKGDTSSWQPYLDVLPTSFTTPGFFSQKEISFLPESIRDRADSERKKLAESYREVFQYAKSNWSEFHNVLSFSNFRWAWYVINTRSVYMESEQSPFLSSLEADNIALAPFLDLLNHSSEANIKAGFNKATECYEIQTFDRYNAYDQVFISYGAHNNKTLFLEYGFCVPNNCQDEFEVSTDIILEMGERFKLENLEKKHEILRENNLLSSLTCSMEGLSWKLSVLLRTLFMTWHELQHWNSVYSDDTNNTSLRGNGAIKMARCIFQYYLKQNGEQQKHILLETSASDNHDHVKLALTLLDMEKNILNMSLGQLYLIQSQTVV